MESQSKAVNAPTERPLLGEHLWESCWFDLASSWVLKSGKFVTEGNKKLRPFHAENSMEACQSSLTIPDPYPPPVHSLPPGSPCCRHPKIPRPFHLQGFLPPALSLFNKHGTKACHDPSDLCIWHWTVKSCAFQF